MDDNVMKLLQSSSDKIDSDSETVVYTCMNMIGFYWSAGSKAADEWTFW